MRGGGRGSAKLWGLITDIKLPKRKSVEAAIERIEMYGNCGFSASERTSKVVARVG